MDAIARTAQWTAAARARESARPDPLFTDPLAAALAGAEGFALLDAEAETGDDPYLAIRTRVFDDWLADVTAGAGVRQVVLLGAGMDSRAFRLLWPEGTTLWELDRPALLAVKEEILTTAGAAPRCDRRTVGAALEGEDWPADVRAAGFDPARPSAWLAEGFFAYLDAATVERVLATTAALAAPGSRIDVDFVSEDFLSCGWMAAYLHRLEERGTPWRFRTNEPEALLARHGWRAERVRQPGEEGAHFGRWPWPVAPRDVPGLPRSFFVAAARAA
jgi:methyltransferase (TIGR00027 family)